MKQLNVHASMEKKSIPDFDRMYDRKLLLLLPTILFFGWLPHLICNWPGSLCPDARAQLKQVFGFQALSNHNPVLDTWIYGGLFKAGRALFGTDNAGITIIIVVQLLLMAFSFSYAIFEGYQILKSRVFIWLSCAFYVFVPIWGGAGQVVLKDSLHMPFFVMMIALQVSLLREPGKGKAIVYGIMLVMVSLTRANAQYYALVGGIVMSGMFLLKRMRYRGVLAGATAGAVLFFIFWESVLLPAVGIMEYPSKEKYSLPFHQIAYLCVHRELDEHETEIINKVLDVEQIREKYNPDSADYLKKMFHGNDNDKAAFMKYYLNCYIKYPGEMIKGLAVSYYKYFDPISVGYKNYRSSIADCKSIGLDLHFENERLRSLMQKYVKFWEKTPLLRLFMGPGLYSLVLIVCFFRCRRLNKLCMVPLLILLIGLLFTPINGETRYAYPILACTPLSYALCRRKQFADKDQGARVAEPSALPGR